MDWTVGRRIAVGLGLEMVLLATIVATGIALLRRTVAGYERAMSVADSVRLGEFRARDAFRHAEVAYLGALLNPTGQAQADYQRAVDGAEAEITAAADAAGTGRGRQAWQQIGSRFQEWKVSASSALASTGTGRSEEVLRIREEETYPHYAQIVGMVEERLAAASAEADSIRAAAAGSAESVTLTLGLGGAAALLLGLVLGVLLARSVTRPLRETSALLASSASEILAATSQHAAGATETSAAVSQTVTTVEQVSQTAEQAAQRARAVSDSARRAAEISQTGRTSVDDAVAATRGVQARVEAIAAGILAMADRAQAIGEIISAVSEIAEQTNILALNAAVEAARAGEHGRGFAVLAAEIKSLADDSKKATVQVREILGEIQRATGSAVMTTEQGTKEAAALARQVEKAGETIRALAEAVSEASQAAAQIAASSGQQAAGVAQIKEAMASIRDTSHQNLAASRQTEQAARDLHAQGDRLLSLVAGGASPARRLD
jgi:methyl-accepting chemotaxis protein